MPGRNGAFCKDCALFDPWSFGGGKEGFCRRDVPHLILRAGQFETVWPAVKGATDYCYYFEDTR